MHCFDWKGEGDLDYFNPFDFPVIIETHTALVVFFSAFQIENVTSDFKIIWKDMKSKLTVWWFLIWFSRACAVDRAHIPKSSVFTLQEKVFHENRDKRKEASRRQCDWKCPWWGDIHVRKGSSLELSFCCGLCPVEKSLLHELPAELGRGESSVLVPQWVVFSEGSQAILRPW